MQERDTPQKHEEPTTLMPKSKADSAASDASNISFKFIKASDRDDERLDWESGIQQARTWLSEALNAKNVAFLLGAGCSSMQENGEEKGIPTMKPLAQEFQTLIEDLVVGIEGIDDKLSDTGYLLNECGIDLRSSIFKENLERLMEVLHSLKFAFSQSQKKEKEHATHAESIINKIQEFLWVKCTRKEIQNPENPVLKVYQEFYRRLVLRDRSLPRPWVFTTNYDLFNETAMDRLGLPYSNGFSGVVERRFNPTTFRYALAEQLDLSNRKWTAVDGFVYLCKLHGSISWSEDDHGLFPIRESLPISKQPGKVMIYPTPAKQNSSLGSPYSDLFREFQSRIAREQSILFTVGYAFGDEHINNIIYQALTIPTFRLIIFADPDNPPLPIKKLIVLNDPRIWVIGGSSPTGSGQAHFFDSVVNHFMPELPNERISDAVEKVMNNLIMRATDKQSESEKSSNPTEGGKK